MGVIAARKQVWNVWIEPTKLVRMAHKMFWKRDQTLIQTFELQGKKDVFFIL